MKLVLSALAVFLVAHAAHAGLDGSPIPAFEATSLTGKTVSSQQLIGQPTVLIVTPSKDAAADTRMWANALRKNLDHKAIRIRDVIAVDLPFFMGERDAIGRAKDKIPARYYDQTWLTSGTKLETALGIPTGSDSAFVFVLDSQGKILARVQGEPTEQRIGEIQSAVQKTQ